MRKSRQRLIIIGSAAVVLAAAAALMVVGLRNTAAFFRTPSEILAEAPSTGTVRVGGLVTIGSYHSEDGVAVFELADDVSSIQVAFRGTVPSLFREGQCVIAEGAVGADGRFSATRVLAKHDEQYRAPEITSSPRLAQSCGSPAATS